MNLITVHTAFNPAGAHLVRAQLEAAGFHPVVEHETASLSIDGYAMAAGGILVRVPENERDDALALLKSNNAQP